VNPRNTIEAFDRFLKQKQVGFEAVAIGGAALAIMGVISRETKDCDILDPQIPKVIQLLAEEFAREQTKIGNVLRPDWLNNGPSSLVKNLPSGWQKRVEPLFSGTHVKLTTLGRLDLLRTKLFAFCDRGTDRQDCLALKPTAKELSECLEWVKHQDSNSKWPKHVEEMFTSLSEEVSNGV
jgi:hypothetical protein